jgi:AraC-like DNA-binding protein
VIKIDYNFTNYEDLLRYYAKCFHAKIHNNSIILPPEVGNGYIKLMSLLNGLQVLVFDYTASTDILFARKKSSKEFYVLRIEETRNEKDMPGKSFVFFGCTYKEWLYMAAANIKLKNISILMSKEWLYNYLGKEASSNSILKFIFIKTPMFHYEIMDGGYRQLFKEIIMDEDDSNIFKPFIIQNRVMLLLESFFTRLYKNINDAHIDINISGEEIERLKLVEKALVSDFSKQPPTITQLGRIAAMSHSKLKVLFKKMYGMPLHGYYQKHRLQKAKAMLISGKYPIKEISDDLGFSGIAGFSKAFKKAFNQTPGEVFRIKNETAD